MLAVQHVSNLAKYFYKMAVSNLTKMKPVTNKGIYLPLRHQFVFLFTVNGLLRGGSAFKAELSDLHNLSVKQKDLDVANGHSKDK